MKLSKKIINKLKTDQAFRLGAATALKIGERQIQNLIEANTDNGNLTKFAAVEYFKANDFSEAEIFTAKKSVKAA